MDGTFHIRSALLGDAAVVAGLCCELGYPCGTDEAKRRLEDLLPRPDHLLLVAAAPDSTPIGWLHAAVRRQLTGDPAVEVVGLVVRESWRGRGAGLALLVAAEEWARGQGVTRLRLRTNIVREEAHAFYLRAGFTRTKTSHLFEKIVG